MITFALYDNKDIHLAKLIHKLSPKKVKILILNFIIRDQYKYKRKRKYLEIEFSQTEIDELYSYFPKDDVILVKSLFSYRWYMRKSEFHITRGRDIYVIKPIKRIKYRILSFSRVFYARMNDSLPYFLKKNIDFKIIYYGKKWLDKKIIGNWLLDKDQDDNLLLENSHLIFAADILGETKKILNKIEIAEIKKELKLPLDKKIVLFSFRKATKEYSFFKSNKEYMLSVKKTLKKLRADGYYIVCRRRVTPKDLNAYPILDIPNSNTDEIKGLFDVEINHNYGFPTAIYKLLHVSDLLYLSDQSAISNVEAALMKCPIFCPFNGSKDDVIKTTGEILPPIKDMLKKGLIFNNLSEENILFFKENIQFYLNEWYETNEEKFWKIVY